MRSKTYLIVMLMVVFSLIVAQCTPAPAPTAAPKQEAPKQEPAKQEPAKQEPTKAPEAKPEVKAKKVVLIGNQRFGDKGPMDDMAAGLEKCKSEFGMEIKKLESESAAQHEEDVRAMAREGYDLVMTTFPPMTEPTKNVAAEFPNTKFAAIYQFINVGGKSIPNIWDTEFHGETAMYILGAVASKLSKSKKIGLISGSEEPSINAEANGYFRGVKDNCADCTVEFAFAGSFEDPAKAKEIAKAMISKGVDVLQTDAGKSQLGAIEAAKEAGNVLVAGDVSDNVDMHPQGFFGFLGVSFGSNVYEACRMFSEGKFPAGQHGIMSIDNKGYFVPYDKIERFGKTNAAYADAVKAAVELGKSLEAKMAKGELKIEFDTKTPSFKGGEAKPSGGVGKKVVLIGNQRFGDKGPMDDMAAGLEKCKSEFGMEIKKLESESAAQHEEDVRAMAREGYDLVMTTFPPMTEPTKNVAAEFPNTKFAAIYQFINVGGKSIPNIWDTEFHGETAMYILGAVASKLSKSKKIGLISGSEEPSINAEANGYFRGVKDNCADCTVEFAFAGSFEDPAKAKEIAKAMISKGVDVIQTDAGKSELGAIEAAKEAGNVLVAGDVSDNVDMHPQGFFGFLGVSFGSNVYEACRMFSEGKFPAGQHGIMSIDNKGYFVPYDKIERFGKTNAAYADAVKAAVELGKSLEAKMAKGELKIEFDTATPKFK